MLVIRRKGDLIEDHGNWTYGGILIHRHTDEILHYFIVVDAAGLSVFLIDEVEEIGRHLVAAYEDVYQTVFPIFCVFMAACIVPIRQVVPAYFNEHVAHARLAETQAICLYDHVRVKFYDASKRAQVAFGYDQVRSEAFPGRGTAAEYDSLAIEVIIHIRCDDYQSLRGRLPYHEFLFLLFC